MREGSVRDYYDGYPERALERPLALTGFFGAGVSRIGNALTSRTGLPGIELLRWVEHRAGCSLSELTLRAGEQAVTALEDALLLKALAERPAGVLMLGDATLMSAENRKAVLEGATLVYLRAQLDALYAGIARDLEASPGCYPAFLLGAPSSPAELLPLFHKRALGYECADVIIDIDERSVTSVATELKERFSL